MKRYAELVRELDGRVDVITLGGIDRYYFAGGSRQFGDCPNSGSTVTVEDQ